MTFIADEIVWNAAPDESKAPRPSDASGCAELHKSRLGRALRGPAGLGVAATRADGLELPLGVVVRLARGGCIGEPFGSPISAMGTARRWC